MITKSNWLLPVALILFVYNSYAQNISPDSVSYNNATARAVDFYNQNIAEQSEIYNGTVYEAPPAAYKGSVYFQDKNYGSPATIRYNGTLYKNIPVLYDSFSDMMIASSRNLVNYILRSEKLSDIYLSDHHFIYLDDQTTNLLKPGFYDQLYSGRITVLVKRTKLPSSNVTSQAVEVTYKDQTDIYIKKQGKYYLVNSKGSVLGILKDKEKELKQYLGNNKIKYNRDREASIAALAQYYDQITN